MRRTLAFSLATLVFSTAAVAFAHAEFVSPPPRNNVGCNSAACKKGPCGGQAKGAPVAAFKHAGTMELTFKETVNHSGCFVLEYQKNQDAGWKTLKVTKDLAGEGTKPIVKYTYDGGLDSMNGTVRLRQLMGANTSTCKANSPAPDGVYFSCADICVGDNCAAPGTTVDAGEVPPDDGTDDAGSAFGDDPTTPTESSEDSDAGGGGADGGLAAEDEELNGPSAAGCSSAGSTTGYGGLAGVVVALGLGLARVRRGSSRDRRSS